MPPTPRRFGRLRPPPRKPRETPESIGPEQRGEEVEVEITGLAPGGDAVGRQVGGATDGRVTFVPLAAPGERVRVQLGRQRAKVAWAELLEIVLK
jgi:23S rRNA (uracil1939-C5)-methyltransferase